MHFLFLEEDVWIGVFQMAPTKAPGADGMPAPFYQHFWNTIGGDVTVA